MKLKKTSKDMLIILLISTLICLYLIFIKQSSNLYSKGFFIAFSIVCLIGVFSESFANIFLKYWFLLGKTLGKINSFVILSILFFVFLFPYALLKRLFSKDDLMQNANQNKSTYVNRNHLYQATDFEKIW